jgi:hypothetical protein
MLEKLKSKGLMPTDFVPILPLRGTSAGDVHMRNTPHIISWVLSLSTWCITPTHADTVYRCGDAYSPSSKCLNAEATEVKPSSVPHTTGQDKSNTPPSDLRELQALEKQRLEGERQIAQTVPVRLSTPTAPPTIVTSHESLTQSAKIKGKHTRKPPNPYFTAVDPSAKSKKKRTAKAVPAASTSSP